MQSSGRVRPERQPVLNLKSTTRSFYQVSVRFILGMLFFVLTPIHASNPLSVGELIVKGEPAGIVFLRKNDLHALGQIQFGARPLQLQARGTILYVASAQGITIVDFANPSEPKTLASHNIFGGAVALAVTGQHCYIAETGGALSALNISHPENPSLIWRNHSAGENSGLAVVGRFAYLAKGDAGIEIHDISGLEDSALINRFAAGGKALDLVVGGGFAYVACGAAGFKIFDVRDPEASREIGMLALPGFCSNVSLFDQIAVVSGRQGGFHVVDITIPSNPVLKKTVDQNTVGARLDLILPPSRGPKVILDCDPGNDIDDVADLAVLHQLANDGELQILGTMYSMRPEFGAPVIEIINRAYGRPDLPVGVSKTSIWNAWDRYGSHLWTNFYHGAGSSEMAPDAVSWYRKTLAAADDKSIIVVLAGQLRNMYDLWRSPPDSDSHLSGRQLMIQKIKRLVAVAGVFPEGFEFNMFVDPLAAQVANEWNGTDMPVTFVGIENGNDVQIGATALNKPINDPVRAGYVQFYQALQVNRRPAWAGLALLFAARDHTHLGVPLFRSVKGRVKVFADGRNEWTDLSVSNVEYLRKEQSDSYYAAILDSLLMRTPVERAESRVCSIDGAEKLSVWNLENPSAPGLISEYEPARLTWAWEPGGIQILWHAHLNGYLLWSAPAPDGPWQPASGPLETIEGQNRYSVHATSEQYFQLRR